MRPQIWSPPIEPSPEERTVMRLIKRAKLFVFLRDNRREIFDESFQKELSAIYRERAGSASLPYLRRNWLWRPYCKPTPAFPTTRRWRPW